VLISTIKNRPAGVDHITCIRVLGEMGPSARAAIPVLRELKEQTNLHKDYFEKAEEALSRMGAGVADAPGIK
jgi:hypothetical protein